MTDRRVKELTAKGEYGKALEVAESLESTEENTLTRFELMLKLGKFKEVISQIREFDSSSYSDHAKFGLHLFMSYSLCQLGEIEQGAKELEKSRELLQTGGIESSSLDDAKAMLANTEGLLLINDGKLKEAENCFLKALEFIGDSDTTLEGSIYNNLGIINWHIGKLERALSYYEKALENKRRTNDRKGVSGLLNNIGIIYFDQGELKLALKYYLESYEMDLEIGNQRSVGLAELNLGELYRHFGQLEKAKDSLSKAAGKFTELGDTLLLSACRYQLLLTCIEIDEKACVQNIINQFSEENTDENPYISLFKKMSQAVFLKQQGRVKSIYESQQLFEEILGGEVILSEITVDALYNLCDILVGELRHYGSVEVLEEINHYSKILLDLAETQKSSKLMAQGLLIQAKAKIIYGELEEAEDLLRQAEKLAMEKEFSKLGYLIVSERDNLLLKRDKWSIQRKTDDEIVELAEDLELRDFFGDMFFKRFNRTEILHETPLALLVLDRGGNTRVVRSFSDKYNLREHLLGSFFSAMNIFAQDLFSSDRSIDRMKFGEYKVAFRHTEKLNFCYIYKGNSYHIENKLSRCIRLFNNHSDVMELLEFTLNNPDLSLFPEMVTAIENIFLSRNRDKY